MDKKLERGGLTHLLSEDEEWVAPLQETVPPAYARSDNLPCERYESVTRFEDFEFL
jgi:hypothetical protein